MSPQAFLHGLRLALVRIGAGILALTAVAEVLLVVANLGRPFIERQPLGTLVPLALACVAAVIASATALALMWRGADRPSARALAWFLGFLALFWASVFLLVFVDDEAAGIPPALAAIRAATPHAINVALWLMPVAFLRFSLLFPRPLTRADLDSAPDHGRTGGADRRWKAVPAVRGILGKLLPDRLRAALAHRRVRPLRAFRIFLLDSRPLWATAVFFGVGPVALLALTPVLGPSDAAAEPSLLIELARALFGASFVLLLLVVLPAVVVLAAGNLRLSYALAGPDDRRRIRWVIDGCVVGVASLVANPFIELAVEGLGLNHAFYQAIPTTLLSGGTLVMSLCLAVGVFYHGALEPTLVVRRNALYVAVGVLLTFIFAGVESLVSSHLTTQLGLPESTGSFVGGGAVALGFGSLRKRFGRLVERWTAGRPAHATHAWPS